MQSLTPHNAMDVSPDALHPDASPDLGKVRDEFRALTSTCGVYELGKRAKLAITGADRVRG